ncbi:hypothetical protein J1N35_038769 [Gossypium stocksii]|uniref:RNase H type-1 domain-containing protein n=1 Tax=Gossypium stocksii TaxID=47602 RepID=A0A9D3UN37_9ROSI|nr:hypothetical protein J1N35_038769 [Gossypium stocksii]
MFYTGEEGASGDEGVIESNKIGVANSGDYIGSCNTVNRPKTMKIICWNIRGLRNPRAIRRLQHTLKLYKPQLVFLMETKVDSTRMERIREKCDFQNGLDVLAIGSCGGLSLASNYLLTSQQPSCEKVIKKFWTEKSNNVLEKLEHLWASEGLFTLLILGSEEGNLKGIRASSRSPQITHLLFADNCILFGEATDKVRSAISNRLGVKRSNNSETYLGLPSVVDRRRRLAFQHLKDHIKVKNDNWSSHLLSQGGKEVFIKAVLQAIPHNGMFPFTKVKLGNLPSYTWKSIWAIKGLLQTGLCWRVGNGHNIRIEEDVWIPNVEQIQINQLVRGQNITRVADLIDSMNRTWKYEIIESTFTEEVAQKILQIPLAHSPHEDFLAWRGESTGEYTVRSGYKLLLHGNLLNNNRYNPIENRECYRKLWNCDLPSKVIITTWRATFNYLPTLVNLRFKRLTNEAVCLRNRWIHEAHPQSGAEIARFILQYLQELKSIHQTHLTLSQIPESWRPLEQGFCKLNFDAAVDSKNQRSCSGIIVRNSNGDVLATKVIVHENIPSMFISEANACLQAAIMGREMRLTHVEIEGDSLTVIKKVQNTGQDKSVIGSYIHDIKDLLKGFHKSQVQHVRRKANEKAHSLASKGLKMEEKTHLTRKNTGSDIQKQRLIGGDAKVFRWVMEMEKKSQNDLGFVLRCFWDELFPNKCFSLKSNGEQLSFEIIF